MSVSQSIIHSFVDLLVWRIVLLLNAFKERNDILSSSPQMLMSVSRSYATVTPSAQTHRAPTPASVVQVSMVMASSALQWFQVG